MSRKELEAFFETARIGDQKKFLEILSKSHKSIIQQSDVNGNNIIHIATENNQGLIIAAFEKFAQKHPEVQFNVNDMNNYGQTPLDIANQHLQNTPGATIVKALESLSRALDEPLYTSESLRVIRNMQIDDFIHSEYDMRKSSNVYLKSRDVEKIT